MRGKEAVKDMLALITGKHCYDLSQQELVATMMTVMVIIAKAWHIKKKRIV